MNEGIPQKPSEEQWTHEELLDRLNTKEEARDLIAALRLEMRTWALAIDDARKARAEATQKPLHSWSGLISDLERKIADQEGFIRSVERKMETLPEA